jgi:molybdenum cofactor cytidylyltransferase
VIVGVLLAAGASTRMGRAKALVKSDGQSFAARGVRHLWSACDTVVMVLGANASRIRRDVELEFARLMESGALRPDLKHARGSGTRDLEVQIVVNQRWRSGMYGSVRAGLAAALEARPQAVMVLPVDHPDVRVATLEALAAMIHGALAACKTPRERRALAYAVVPRYRRRRGHPVVMTPALAAAIAADRDAEHLSDALRRHARLIGYLDVADAGVVRNVNRPED